MRYRSRCVLVCWALAMASPPMLSGQTVPDRRFLQAIFADARSAATAGAVPLLSHCDGRDPDVVIICEAGIAVHHSPLAGRREEVFAAHELAIRAVFDQDRWPYAWFVLGLVRLRLAHDKVVPEAGPALPVGASNDLGGTNALIVALELDPGFAAAADALALAPEPPEGFQALTPRIAMLRRVRTLLSPAANAAAALLERDGGSVDSAVALERRALATGGVDSGVVLLSLARDLYRANRPAEGRAALFAGAGTTTEAGRNAYRNQLAWVASPPELARWDSLAAAERPGWLAGFWATRDAAELRPDGSRLVEHYRRVEYAMTHFRLALVDGELPRSVTFVQPDEYHDERLGLAFAAQHAELCPETARFVADARMMGADVRTRYFEPVQQLVDDRGAVWIRHGAPTRSRQSNSGEAAEIWRYERPEGPLVLQFRAAALPGASSASVLVPSLLTLPPGMRNQVCALETSICSRLGVTGPLQPGDTVLLRSPIEVGVCVECLPTIDPVTHRRIRIPPGVPGMKLIAQLSERCRDPIARVLEREVHAEGTLLSTGAIRRARDTGRAEIDLATTTDTDHRDFATPMHPALQVLGLDRAGGSAPRLVVAFTLRVDELAMAGIDPATGRVAYPVSLHVAVANARDGTRTDVDSLRQLVQDEATGRDRVASGLLDIPVPPGRYAVGVEFRQADGRGAVAQVTGAVVPGDAPRLALSDLVIGRENSGVAWNSGTTRVALNPREGYPRGGSAEVYFQVSAMRPGASYQTRFEFWRADDDPKRGPRLALSSDQVAQQPRMEVSRSLGLQRLDPGRYRVKLIVSGDGASATAMAWLTIAR